MSRREAVVSPREDDNLRTGWRAITQGAGVIRLSDFGVLRVAGRDSVSWLHKLITANIETMSDGEGAYALLLEAKGHVLADFVLLKQLDSFLIYTSRPAHEQLMFNLRRFIFREKVTLTDLSDQLSIISLQGPNSHAIIQNAFAAYLQPPLSNLPVSQSLNRSISRFNFTPLLITNHQILVVRYPRAAATGFDLLAPSDAIPALVDTLIANGAQPVSLDALNIARVEAGIPWHGDDFDATTLAPEARLDAFIAENKGCYTGQEVIARIRNFGHVNRFLVQIQIDSETIPLRGEGVFVDGNQVGSITSSVWSYAHNAPHALGYIRREFALDGTHAQVAHGTERLNATVLHQVN